MKADRLVASSVVVVAVFLPGCFDGEDGYLEVSPDSVTIQAWADGSWPAARMVTMRRSRGDIWVDIKAPSLPVWTSGLQVEPAIMIMFDPSGVGPGTYCDQLRVNVQNTNGPPFWAGEATISVTVNVFDEPGQPFPGLVFEGSSNPFVENTYFYFSVPEGTPGLTTQSLRLINQGGGTLNWTITADQEWLSVDPAAGDTTTEQDDITVGVNVTGLTADKQHDYYDYSYYYGTITVASNSPFLAEETIHVILFLHDQSGGSMRG